MKEYTFDQKMFLAGVNESLEQIKALFAKFNLTIDFIITKQ